MKIHVPKLIKHHIHTKTVYIHLHGTEPIAVLKTPEEENYMKDWASYNTLNYNSLTENHVGQQHYKKLRLVNKDIYKPTPFNKKVVLKIPSEKYRIQSYKDVNDDDLGLFEVPTNPNDDEFNINVHELTKRPVAVLHYDIHEDVKEDSPEDDPDQKNSYGGTYHRDIHSESGHVIQKDHTNFYDKENEEEDFAKTMYENNAFDKYSDQGNYAMYDKEMGNEQRAIRNLPSRKIYRPLAAK
uniref:Uncharacterized protein n=1 Tax=Trichogramma kaykai TaxID=54128 RepID=A0ABD2XI63_9HYME